MSGPLTRGQRIARLDRPWSWRDPAVEIRSDGKAFDSAAAAERYARQRATSGNADAVLVKDQNNRIWVYEVNELTRLGGNNDLDTDVRGKLGELALPAGLSLQGFMASRRNAPRSVQTIRMQRWNRIEPDAVAAALADYPSYRTRLTAALQRAEPVLGRAGRGVQPGGQAAAALQAASDQLAAVVRNIDAGDYRLAADTLAKLDGTLSKAQRQVPSGYSTDVLTQVRRNIAPRVSPPQRLGTVPAPVLARAQALFAAYGQQTQLALDAIYADGYAEFVDTFDGSGRIRPDDAADACLRLNASLWTVLRDLRHGTIEPAAFGQTDWAEVSPRDIYDLAFQRLRAGSVDYGAVIPTMLADPAWKAHPVEIRTADGRSMELAPKSISHLWKRSIDSLVAPDTTAAAIESYGFAHRMRDAAVQVAAADPEHRQRTADAASIGSAYSLFEGHDLPPNASQALLTMVTATGISVAAPGIAPAGATEASLKQQVKKGEIAAFTKVGPTFIVFHQKSVPQLAAEIRARIHDHELDGLGPTALSQLEQMTGPGDHPGALLQQRLKSEGRARKWRELASQAIEIAAIGAVSGGVGAFVDGVGAGVELSYGVVRAAGFVANAATFTTLSGAVQGKIDPAQYPVDMLMFAVLGLAGRFSELATKLVPGSGTAAELGKLAVAHGVSVAGAASVLSGFSVLEQTARGRSPTWQHTKEEFARNLALVGILHGVNLGMAKLAPTLVGNPAAQAQLAELRSRVSSEGKQLASTLNELSTVLARAGKGADASPAQAAASAERVEALMAEVNAQSGSVHSLEGDLATLAQHAKAPDAAGSKAVESPAAVVARDAAGPKTAQAPAAGPVRDAAGSKTAQAPAAGPVRDAAGSKTAADAATPSVIDAAESEVDVAPSADQVSAAQASLSRPSTSAQRAAELQVLETAAGDPTATVKSRTKLGGGINTTQIVTLSNGLKAVWKPLAGENMTKLRNNIEEDHQARREAAAYVVDAAMGHLAGVPPTVFRTLDGQEGALMTFVKARPGAAGPAPSAAEQMRVGVFDEVIGNMDRHRGNYLIAGDGAIVPIDHGLTFPLENTEQGWGNMAFAVDAKLQPEHMHALERLLGQRAQVTDALEKLGIDRRAIDAMFARADEMVRTGWARSSWVHGVGPSVAGPPDPMDAIRNIR